MVKTMKRIISTLLVCVLLLGCAFTLASCKKTDASKDLENIKKEGKLVVGMECAYAPYNWTTPEASDTTVPIANNPGSYADGYDVQIAKMIARELGVELEIRGIEWDGLIPALESGMIDMIIAGMSPTEERKRSIDFSDVYLYSELVMVVRKDGNYANATKIQDFSGAKISAQLSTFHYTVIDQINGVNKHTALENFSALIQNLQAGTIDGYVCEEPGAISAAASNPNFTYIKFGAGNGFDCDPTESSISIGMRKGSSLTEVANKVIASIPEATRLEMMAAAISRQPVAKQSEN